MAEAYWTYCMYYRGMICGVEILEDNDDVVILYAHRQCHRQELQYLLQALRLAQEQDLIEWLPKVRKYRETNVRQGLFSKEDFDRLVSFLPEDIQDFVRFGYYSGWRKGEITRFEWRDVHDTVIRLRPEVSKNKDGWVLALIGEIGEIIQRRRALRDKTAPYVFHRNGRQVKDFRKAWRTAWRKADIPIRDLQLGVKDGRVFHDLRRTTARNLIRAVVPDRIAMGLMGHKTRVSDHRGTTRATLSGCPASSLGDDNPDW